MTFTELAAALDEAKKTKELAEQGVRDAKAAHVAATSYLDSVTHDYNKLVGQMKGMLGIKEVVTEDEAAVDMKRIVMDAQRLRNK